MECGVRKGLDRILEDPAAFPRAFEAGARLGFITSDGSPPGPWGMGSGSIQPDGAPVGDGRDEVTGLPVTSLYGPRLAPPVRELAELDLVLFDLQDVGARFYTFLWTLSLVMEACAEAGTPLWVLDRPNPLGGLPDWVEGPLPDPNAPPTFLGRWPIPIRHSLTLGEMALLFRAEMGLELDLKVVAMEGWRREHLWPASGLPFHPPSPGIPTFRSALLYPGLVLLEATNVLDGRGTELAFQWFGAPWMDPEVGAAAVNDAGIPGVRARPRDLPRNGTPCPGVILEVTDASALRPVYMGMRLLTLLRTFWPEKFEWAAYPTAVNPTGGDHLYRLLSSRALVSYLEKDPGDIGDARLRQWTRAQGWWERAEPHLLYF
jgi:uncharacterized protein YbbC (DUF1343 family)